MNAVPVKSTLIDALMALVIPIEMWIAKVWTRRLRIEQLSAIGAITFWSPLTYLGFRLAAMALRDKLANTFSGGVGTLFAVEIVLGGVVPLILLARASQRAMDLKGPMSQIAPSTYSPSIFEWGISVGLIAATIFLFGLGARLMPVLPKEATHEGSLIA